MREPKSNVTHINWSNALYIHVFDVTHMRDSKRHVKHINWYNAVYIHVFDVTHMRESKRHVTHINWYNTLYIHDVFHHQKHEDDEKHGRMSKSLVTHRNWRLCFRCDTYARVKKSCHTHTCLTWLQLWVVHQRVMSRIQIDTSLVSNSRHAIHLFYGWHDFLTRTWQTLRVMSHITRINWYKSFFFNRKYAMLCVVCVTWLLDSYLTHL